MTTHRLKTVGEFWDAVNSGAKNFEVRLNDRGFQKGDILELLRLRGDGSPDYNIVSRGVPYEPKLAIREVTYLLQGGQFGLEPLWCVMGLKELTAKATP